MERTGCVYTVVQWASSEKVKKGDKFNDILAVDIPVYLYAALHSIPGATFRAMENSSQHIVLYRPLREGEGFLSRRKDLPGHGFV